MKAIVITGTGGPEVLQIREVPTPEPQGMRSESACEPAD